MYLKITTSKLAIILIRRIQKNLNKTSLINYNISGVVKKCISICKDNKNIDWENVNDIIQNINLSDEEQKIEKKVTTLVISQEHYDYLLNILKPELAHIFSSRIYASTALNFVLAYGYLNLK